MFKVSISMNELGQLPLLVLTCLSIFCSLSSFCLSLSGFAAIFTRNGSCPVFSSQATKQMISPQSVVTTLFTHNTSPESPSRTTTADQTNQRTKKQINKKGRKQNHRAHKALKGKNYDSKKKNKNVDNTFVCTAVT